MGEIYGPELDKGSIVPWGKKLPPIKKNVGEWNCYDNEKQNKKEMETIFSYCGWHFLADVVHNYYFWF